MLKYHRFSVFQRSGDDHRHYSSPELRFLDFLSRYRNFLLKIPLTR